MLISDMYVVRIQDGLEEKSLNVMAENRSRAHGTVRRAHPDAHIEEIQLYKKGLLVDTSMVRNIVNSQIAKQ